MTDLLTPAHRVSRSPEVLRALRESDCNLAIWERPAPASIGLEAFDGADDVRITASLDSLASVLAEELENCGFAGEPARAALIEDVEHLAQLFAGVLDLDAVEVRLEVVTGNSCRKFHADYVTARLITTYFGTGTQWLDDADADRIAMGDEPSRIQTLGAGDVGLFKGKLSTQRPAIHRSPPIEGTGEKRLLMVLNPPPVEA